MAAKIKHLVVDTSAFLKNANLQDLAENIYTVQEVIDEITNDRQRRKLVVLPYDIIVKDVFTENIKVITDFSKKTGDYKSLSATDIKVMSLSYQLEKEKVGTDHLKTEPTMQKTVTVTGLGKKNSDSNPDLTERNNSNTIDSAHDLSQDESAKQNEPQEDVAEDINLDIAKDDHIDINLDLEQKIKSMDLNDSEIDDVLVKVDNEDNTSQNESDNSEGEWITPGNITEKKKEIDGGDYFEDKSVEVACITSDFAMQNVLKQIGLNVTSVDGRIIRQLRTFIFRCTACFKTTSVMTKVFCPKCGHNTLRKVAVSVDEQGNQHIHINGRKPLTARGKKFSLPTPRGGQHFQYPILTEDQHIHKRFATQLARKKNNPLDPEYVAGFSPFVMRDVNSKSAVLGVRANKQDIKYWMKHHSSSKKKK